MLRSRLRESKPTSQRLELAQDARDKAARKHIQVGEDNEALRLLLEAKNQAWMVAASALEVAQREVDAWATRLGWEQEQVSVAAMQGRRHAAALGGGFCRGVAAGDRQVISVVLAGRDEAPPFG